MKKFEEEIDAWIKVMNTRLNELEISMKEEKINSDNIQHNYELIQELHDEVKMMKNELRAVRKVLISVIMQSMRKTL